MALGHERLHLLRGRAAVHLGVFAHQAPQCRAQVAVAVRQRARGCRVRGTQTFQRGAQDGVGCIPTDAPPAAHGKQVLQVVQRQVAGHGATMPSAVEAALRYSKLTPNSRASAGARENITRAMNDATHCMFDHGRPARRIAAPRASAARW